MIPPFKTLFSPSAEYPVVIFPLLKQHFMMLQRNLVYTGLTRAKKKVVFVGDPAAYAMAIRNNKTLERQTDLIRKLKEKMKITSNSDKSQKRE